MLWQTIAKKIEKIELTAAFEPPANSFLSALIFYARFIQD